MHFLFIFFAAIFAFLVGTVCQDLGHYLLHRGLRSKNKWWIKLGKLHLSHHRFYSPALKIDNHFAQANILHHASVEWLLQMIGILVCAFFLPWLAILLAILFSTGMFIYIYHVKGVDLHHQPISALKAHKGGFFVSADYHALHHVYPLYFYSSYIKILDYILGKASPLMGKQIAMTGANGALGSAMRVLLEKEGARISTFKFGVDYTYDDYSRLRDVLAQADILLLCHGSKLEHAQAANCDSYIAIIELFKQVRKKSFVPLEIWATGSEIECHPCFGIKNIKIYAQSKRNYAVKARQYFYENDILYRHLVHSAFTSPMGRGLMSAKFAAYMTLFWLKRGFKYVPVTYTGFAYLNYFRFLFSKPIRKS